ncbi:PREDICTED: uncharacterized protein LOC109338675, partial [Lupinus angustifolius]|uniref:uncharacterized protein LOC109338675 n=1 Tax=Lupinus angustifolius TaxID=3871 RepID=UPI00092E8967
MTFKTKDLGYLKYFVGFEIARSKTGISMNQRRRLIGRLIYFTNTRCDINFCVNQLAQFMARPTILHHTSALKILRYLKGSPTLGLFFLAYSVVKLKAYSDSEWASYPDTR